MWMDSSTGDQCVQLETAVGGAGQLATITGSRAYERFTGSQIRKLVKQRPEWYNNTERISLVSSFAASLLAGKIVDIDWSDAGGMNLLDINSRSWDQTLLDVSSNEVAAIIIFNRILQAVGTDMASKLGTPVSSKTVVGTVSEYMFER